MKTVEDAIRAIPFQEADNYAAINGKPSFIDAMMDSVLHEHRPKDTYMAGVATPGGTGALHNSFYNYLNEGEVCLTTSYFWGNYRSLLTEIGRDIETFNTFTPEGHFDMEA